MPKNPIFVLAELIKVELTCRDIVKTRCKLAGVNAMNKKQLRARATMMETLANREGYFETSYARQNKVQKELRKNNDERKRVA